jgi:hypothetical protein
VLAWALPHGAGRQKKARETERGAEMFVEKIYAHQRRWDPFHLRLPNRSVTCVDRYGICFLVKQMHIAERRLTLGVLK